MSDSFVTQGLSLIGGPDQSPLLEEEIDSGRVDGETATRLASVLCQIDELRRLNKRIELDNLGLAAHNRELRVSLARLEARVADVATRNQELQARVGSQRYRMIDRIYDIVQRVPLCLHVSKFLLRKGWRAARRLRSWLGG